MNCPEIYPLLHAYVDSELDLMPSLEVDRHLKSCAECTAAKRSLESLRATLRQNDLSYRAPESLRARIRESIGESPTKVPLPSSRPWMWQMLALGSLGFAVVTLILQPAAVNDRDRLADDAISDHVRSLMPGHLMDVVSTDQHTVKPWFNGRIDFAPEVRDFATQGFPLVGGRLDYLNGQNVVALIYRRNQHTINTFVWPAKTATDQSAVERRGFSIINRDIRGLHYCLVSDLNPRELNEFATLLTE